MKKALALNKRTRDREPFPCPHCGELVPANARACRICGASDDCGWGDDEDFGLDESEADFDYDEYIAREFPEHATSGSQAMTGRFWVTAIMILLVIGFLLSSI